MTTRSFSGKDFVLYAGFVGKSAAAKNAIGLRKDGYSVRIINQRVDGKPSKDYHVWRSKSKKS